MRAAPGVPGRSVRLDPENQQAWLGDRVLALSPKAFSVLRCLVERAGRLVTKQELLDAVWPDVTVSEGVLTTCVREIRKQLRDRAHAPRYVETVHGRGYRFMEASTAPIRGAPAAQDKGVARGGAPLVGREAELAQLGAWLGKSLAAERQIVFVAGEAGIGKTALVDRFLERLDDSVVRVGRGQCLERYGADEPYFPVLELLGRLGQDAGGERLVELLRRHAPSWLAQLPSLVTPEDLEALERRTVGVTAGRMLREFAEAIEAATHDFPLILVLEDLHWSDHATVSLVSLLAQRREPARLLLIGTYRPVDVIVREHPLKEVKQSLRMRRQCDELALEGLSEAEVGEYLTQRFSAAEPGAFRRVASIIHRRTEGNPLFMVNLGDTLVARELLVQRQERWELAGALEDIAEAVPESLREMIEQQLERCDVREQRALEAASVVGAEFSGAAVAAALELDVEAAEERCRRLARRGQFLHARGREDWPDGTVTTRYGFLHAAYSEVLYDRLTAPTRVALHRRIGERLEAGNYGRTADIAAELAAHFEEGRDPDRAVEYLQQAAESAIQGRAYVEAAHLLTRALEQLRIQQETGEQRVRKELELQSALAMSLSRTEGYSALEAEKAYRRTRELCEQTMDLHRLCFALLGLFDLYTVRAELDAAYDIGDELLSAASRISEPVFVIGGHFALGMTSFNRGEFVEAAQHLERGIAFDVSHPERSAPPNQDPGAACRSFAALTLWFLGHPDRSLAMASDALTVARRRGQPFDVAFASHFAAWLHQLRGDWRAAREHAETVIALSDDHGFKYFRGLAEVLHGWQLARERDGTQGIEQMLRGIDACRTAGVKIAIPHFQSMLADVYHREQRTDEALAAVSVGLSEAADTGGHSYDAELHRLRGEVLLAQTSRPAAARESEAESCFASAIEVARRQNAKSWELRATTCLSRLLSARGETERARELLAGIYGSFVEGFDTVDLVEAKSLLESVG